MMLPNPNHGYSNAGGPDRCNARKLEGEGQSPMFRSVSQNAQRRRAESGEGRDGQPSTSHAAVKTPIPVGSFIQCRRREAPDLDNHEPEQILKQSRLLQGSRRLNPERGGLIDGHGFFAQVAAVRVAGGELDAVRASRGEDVTGILGGRGSSIAEAPRP